MTQTHPLVPAVQRHDVFRDASARAAVGGDPVDREIARARRHGSPLTLVRLTIAAPSEWSAAQQPHPVEILVGLLAALRQVDLPFLDGTSLYVVCPDTSREEGRGLLDRLIVKLGDIDVDVDASGVATFPYDGLTIEALLDAVGHHSGIPPRPYSWARPRRRRLYRLCKRLIELALVALTLPVTVAVIALCGLAVRLDSHGPVFFQQVRTGRNGRRFTMYKLRTMVVDADNHKERLAAHNLIGGPDFKVIDDPRITRVGRVLRRTSLDELPQLWNVVTGDMSLIGPRPTSFAPDTYDLWHTRRLDVTPGLTGLWQVAGRNTTSFDERLRLDIYYMEHESLRLDLAILFLTVKSMVARAGH